MSTPKLYAAATARADRAEGALNLIENIACAFVSDPGCEMNTVDKVKEMGHMIQRLRAHGPNL